jgi:L-alanine-DL-glutamate epimerase-like enolase superfamily enzyme
VIASQSPGTCPIQECLIKWNTINQFFLKEKLTPRNGTISLPGDPSLGMALDESAVREE